MKAMQGMKRAWTKLESGTSKAWSKSAESVQRGMDTSKEAVKQLTDKQPKEPDVMADSEEDALTMLKQEVESAKSAKQKRPQKWNFATVPLDCFSKTLDDILMAFVRWSKTDDGKFNLTRAFERLTAYATWMDNTGRDMIDPPLTTESIKDAWTAWNMKVSYDKAGHFVWWFDIAQLDVEKVKAIPVEENLRLFVWLAHFAMLDPQAQQNGCVLVENLGKLQLWTGMTLIQPNLARKIDRLTIGTMPVKMKQVYVCESPQWATVLTKMMKPFLSPVVKDRIVFLENPKVLEDILGLDCIPTGFVGTEGKLEKDIVWAAMSMD